MQNTCQKTLPPQHQRQHVSELLSEAIENTDTSGLGPMEVGNTAWITLLHILRGEELFCPKCHTKFPHVGGNKLGVGSVCRHCYADRLLPGEMLLASLGNRRADAEYARNIVVDTWPQNIECGACHTPTPHMLIKYSHGHAYCPTCHEKRWVTGRTR